MLDLYIHVLILVSLYVRSVSLIHVLIIVSLDVRSVHTCSDSVSL